MPIVHGQQVPISVVQGQQAVDNLAAQAANVILYGPPGSEKTTDAIKAFVKDGRCGAFVITCEDGALKPVLARGLPVPDHVQAPVKSWSDMQQAMNWLVSNRQNYTACIIDTLSTFTAYLYREVSEALSGERNRYIVPTTMRNCLFELREWIRNIGLHSVMICHALEPVVLDGVFHRGGPLLSPKTMVENYFGLIDTVLRVDYMETPMGRKRVYWTGGEVWPSNAGMRPLDAAAWRTKNREGCGAAVVPADLGEFLRGRQPPYPGL